MARGFGMEGLLARDVILDGDDGSVHRTLALKTGSTYHQPFAVCRSPQRKSANSER
jgi:hypothetical protein